MNNSLWKQRIKETIQKIEQGIGNQKHLDHIYETFCNDTLQEMDNSLQYREINSKKIRKNLKTNKPYWDAELTEMWKITRDKEKAYVKYKGKYKFIKQRLRQEYKNEQNNFDKAL